MSEIDDITVEPAVTKPKKSGAKKVSIIDSTLIKVKSCYFGKLVYKNPATQERYIWSKQGEIQLMPISELRQMKARQMGFFKNQDILIVGAADGEDENITVEDIYNTLVLGQYYRSLIHFENPSELLSWSVSEIPEKVALLPSTARENLIFALNTYIENGKLDSLSKIRAFEKALRCELVAIQSFNDDEEDKKKKRP